MVYGLTVKEHELISYERLKYVKIFINEVNYRTPHIHDDFEICVVLRGETNFKISGVDYCCKESDIIICNPLEIHETYTDDYVLLLCIQFSSEYLKQVGYDNVVFDMSYISGKDRIKYKRTYEAIHRLAKSYLYGGKDIKLLSYGWLNILVHYLLENSPKRGQVKRIKVDDNRQTINTIIKYLNEHYSEKISLLEISDMVHLNQQYLSRLFKKYTGVTFQDFLTTIRLNQAYYLINETDENLIDICFACGFSDYKYLNSVFQKQYGCSPKEYRLKHPRRKNRDKSDNKEKVYEREEILELIGSRIGSKNQ